MMKRVFKKNFYGRELIVEQGSLAKQADGAVLVRYGDTVVLTTSVVSKNVNLFSDFFPLMVLYQEKLYSVGKIPGGFIKREARPSEAATLAARMIDRPMRPLFPDGFKNEVQVVNTVLSVEQDNSPEMTAMFGSSLATSISRIPFLGPIAGVKVGRVDGKLIVNPTAKEMEESDIELIVAGTKDAINMVESSAKQVSEEDMLEALLLGHEAIKELVSFQEEIIEEIGQEKMSYQTLEITDEFRKEVISLVRDKVNVALRIIDKLDMHRALDTIKCELMDLYHEKYNDISIDERRELDARLTILYDEVQYELFRLIIVKDKVRADGRAMTEIRPLATEIDLLPRTHGSAVFTRGETQSLSVTTLGALGEHQILDGLGIEDQKRFMLHYNFPSFSVGETGRYGAPGRREIGHGALGEKALAQVMPTEDEFPYTIRVVSEILESNGSSSQASICAGCMSLMAAGVPIKSPVAGIAMGLISDGENYTILTDIQGMEDHLGDMDFKVAGTKNGICALQMDIKIKGITRQILEEALQQARDARMEILDVIEKEIKEPRSEVSKYAPKTFVFYIKPEKIKEVIGRGGEMITKIICESSNVLDVNNINAVKVDLEDDGRVIIYHTDQSIIDRTVKMIQDVIKEAEEGTIYTARVVKVEDFGCFVQLWPGCEGLVHVSQLARERIDKAGDVVSLGDEIAVKCLGVDKKGRLNFSRKDVLEDAEKSKEKHDKKESEKELD